MSRTYPLLAAVLCSAILVACGGRSTPVPTPAVGSPTPPASSMIAAGQPIVIGVSAALSGDQAALGTDLADAVELAVADHGGSVKGHPVTVKREDDSCTDAEKATQAARNLIADPGIAGVIGPMCTVGAQAADPLYEAAHLVHISASVTRTDLSAQGEQYFFRTAWRDDEQGIVQARYAWNTIHARTVALIDDGSAYGKELGDAFAGAFQKSGGNVISRDRIDPAATDFSALATRVQGAAPDAVVFEGFNPAGALLAKALHQASFTGAFIAPDGVMNVRDFIGTGGSNVEGAYVTGGPTPSGLFVAHFQDRFHHAPATPFVLQAYDAATILLQAIDGVAAQESGSALVIDRAKLAAEIRAQSTEGQTGPIQFDQHGDRRSDTAASAGLTVYRVTNGRFQAVP